MLAMTPADALRLAINALRDVAESLKMPSGIELDNASAELHAKAAEVLDTVLADMRVHE